MAFYGKTFSLSVLSLLLASACGGPPPPQPEVDAGVVPPITTALCLDNDGDGVPGTGDCAEAPQFDCDDANPMRYPGAPERCNDRDDDCDDEVDEGLETPTWYSDRDGDGFGGLPTGEQDCSPPPEGVVLVDGDCDDDDAARHPDAAELCNDVDDDCNGTIDEGQTFTDFYPDGDFDGAGNPNGTPVSSCHATVSGHVANGDDCDDVNPTIRPGAAELCNKVDDDCNGEVDDRLTYTDYFVDTDGDGFGDASATAESSCSPISGLSTNRLDCNDLDATVKPGAPEVCNASDDDCDGAIDEGLAFIIYYPDMDGDGSGDASGSPVSACRQPVGYVGNPNDCDDGNPSIKPMAPETCNQVDDDCDGQTDEGLAQVAYYRDNDGDTWGSGAQVLSCSALSGHATRAGDCKDNDPTIHPGIDERCNGVDDDCDGQVDDGLAFSAYYPDVDGDSYGSSSASPLNACSAVAGHVTDNTDCNDANMAIRPNAPEVCNGVDDDCDGAIDDGTVNQDWWPDGDGDGYGNGAVAAESSCAQPPGKVSNSGDCDDSLASVRPGATETCDQRDEDCDGAIDEGLATLPYYPDSDGDGFGAATATAEHACSPISGKVSDATDCDDGRASVNPQGLEACNSLDDDCDGSIDEGNPGGGAACLTGESGVCSDGSETCQGGTFVCKRNTEPSAELCNELDDDCDGSVDETFTDKGQTCQVGLGVCVNSGTLVCRSDGTGTECNVQPKAPQSPACDGQDDDCDGIVDEPVLTRTADVHGVAWTDIEVAPFYHSDAGCAAGTSTATNSDSLRGGLAVFASDLRDHLPDGGIGTDGVSSFGLQVLNTGGDSTSGLLTYSFRYKDMDLAQSGDGVLVAGIYVGGSPEIDLYLFNFDGTKRASKLSQFRPPNTTTDTLDSLQVVRGSGRSVMLIWREVIRDSTGAVTNVNLKASRVTPPDAGSTTWTIAPVLTLVSGASLQQGIGAASDFVDWNLSQTCHRGSDDTIITIAYRHDPYTLKWFSIYDDITDPTAKTVVDLDFVNTSTVLSEPEVVHYTSGGVSQWFAAYTISWDTGGEDLAYYMTTMSNWRAYATELVPSGNGSDSVRRPRASVFSNSELWVSALKFEAPDSLQTMTRRILSADGGVNPVSPDVEISPTTLTCDGGSDCRPGQKSGLTSWARTRRVFYSASGASPAGSFSSDLTCH